MNVCTTFALLVTAGCNSEISDISGGRAASVVPTSGTGSTPVVAPGVAGNFNTPNSLTAVAMSSAVQLVWTPPGHDGPFKYSVYRRLQSGGDYSLVTNNITDTTYMDYVALNGVAYTYRVRAYRTSGVFSDTNEDSAMAIQSFALNLMTQQQNGDVIVSWSPAVGAETFDVVTGANGDFNTVLKAGATSPATLTGLTPGTYTLQVIAKNSVGQGAKVRSSSVLRGTLISNFSVSLTGAATGLQVNLPTLLGVDRFRIFWGTSSGSYTSNVEIPVASTYTITTVSPNTHYYVLVYAFAGSNGLEAQNEVNFVYGAPVTQSWTFDAGTEAQYSSSTNFTTMAFSAGGVCKLLPGATAFVDSTSSDFALGSATGMVWDNSNNVFRLGTAGGCNGLAGTCNADLDPSWTPKYSNILNYWKFENNWNDSVGGNNGTPSGSVSFVSGAQRASSTAAYFTGGQTSITTSPAWNFGAGSFSIGFWFKKTAGGRAHAVQLGSSGNNISFDFDDSGIGVWAYWMGGGTPHIYVARGFTNYGWHYLTFTRAGTTFSLYIDGVLSGQTTDSSSINLSGASCIGSACGSWMWPGQVDDVAIWNAALTQDDISAIYSRQSSKYWGQLTSRVMDGGANVNWPSTFWSSKLPFGKELPDNALSEGAGAYPALATSTLMSGVVGEWHLNEPVLGSAPGGKDFKDSSGNGNHATALGTVTPGRRGQLQTAPELYHVGAMTVASTETFAGGVATVSAWINYRAVYNCMVFGFALYDLYFYTGGNMFGFNTANGDVYGVNIDYTNWREKWVHVVAEFHEANITQNKLWINGVPQTLTQKLGSPTAGNAHLQGNFKIGGWMNDTGYNFDGLMDEVAVWNRALSNLEAKQLYQRGANRLKLQVRGCNQADCSDGSWRGPDGTNSTYFTELNNNSAPLAANGNVQTSSATMTFSNFTSPPAASRYFQYRVIAESDDYSNQCNYGSGSVPCSPEITRVGLNATTAFDLSKPWVQYNTGMPFIQLISLSETLGGGGCPGGVGYILSLDQTLWYYHNGAGWVLSDGTAAKSNTASSLNAVISSFGTRVGSGTLYMRAILKSDGSTPCELDSVVLNGLQ